jgi:ABC-type antimicrobial peptide transport system permease subunit
MSINIISDIMQFFGIEESNVLGNIANLGTDFFLIYNLDLLYKSCTALRAIDDRSLKMPVFLYLIVNAEFYNSISSYLRLHKSISFRCMRSALDATFTSYYLLKKPEKLDVYLSKLGDDKNKEMVKEWNKTFRNIKRTINDNIKEFPLAKGLPEIHEFCSIYSHSDALGILHRYQEDKGSSMLLAKYFDYEKKNDDFHKWLTCFLVTYFNIWLLYWREVFIHIADNKLNEIEKNIVEFQNNLKNYTERYPFKISVADNND